LSPSLSTSASESPSVSASISPSSSLSLGASAQPVILVDGRLAIQLDGIYYIFI
jgi:hypothetical protein